MNATIPTSKLLIYGTLIAAVMLGSDPASATNLSATAIDAYTVNEYWESQLHEYGTSVGWSIADGATYANLSSTVTAIAGTSTQSGTHTQRDLATWWPWPLSPPLATPPSFVGSTATILAGTNNTGSAQNVTMAWRNRADIEVDTRGYPYLNIQQPPMAYDSYGMVSDIVDLHNASGIYVLEMTYDDSQLILTIPSPNNTEEWHAETGWIYLGWFEDVANAGGGNHPDREWVNAVDGNSTTGVSAVANYQGSYADYLADGSVSDAGDLDKTLGSWGVDIDDNTVWAVIDHNSEFGAVPEPQSLAVIVLGMLLLTARRRRLA